LGAEVGGQYFCIGENPAQGLGRLFGARFSPEIGWLIPFAVLALVLGLLARRRAGRTDPGAWRPRYVGNLAAGQLVWATYLWSGHGTFLPWVIPVTLVAAMGAVAC
jgi:hypothetical protein